MGFVGRLAVGDGLARAGRSRPRGDGAARASGGDRVTVGTLTDWGHVNRYEIWPQWRAKYAPDVTHNTEHVFGFLVDSATVATLDPTEHVAQLWLPWQEAMERTFSPTNREAISQLPWRATKL